MVIGSVAALSLVLVFAVLNDPLLPIKFKSFQTEAQETVSPCSTKGTLSVLYKGQCVRPEEEENQKKLDQMCLDDPERMNKEHESVWYSYRDKSTNQVMSYCDWRAAGNFSPFGAAAPHD